MVLKRVGNYQRGQVDTPSNIIKLFWKILSEHRTSLNKVLDMGAGDGRFVNGGHFTHYDGYEIDENRLPAIKLPKNAKIIYDCAFKDLENKYDGCIGNPPYVRRQDIGIGWKKEIHAMIQDKLGFALDLRCNLFVYFMSLGLIKTLPDGIVTLIVPYEWVSRPSVLPLREYILGQEWGVHVYRFKDQVFNGFLTTASITIIDKAERSKDWRYYTIDSKFTVSSMKRVTGTRFQALDYSKRSEIWSMRGLSPGIQEVFTLTEGERIHNNLKRSDVVPCVTSLRDTSSTLKVLDKDSFNKLFVKKGLRCWLIRSNSSRKKISDSLMAYINNVPHSKRDNYTCNRRDLWYVYPEHPESDLLYASGFTHFGPKVVINTIGAIAVGSVHGIHSDVRYSKKALRDYLICINFQERVVAHAGSLKKIEVKQMNSILKQFLEMRNSND